MPADLPFTTTLFVRDNCLCLQVQQAARALARLFDDALRPAGLTSGQFSLLMSLNRPEAAHMAQIASVLAMDRTTLTANLKPLQRRGFVHVLTGPADKRQRFVTLTDAGRSTLAAAMPIWHHTHQSIEARLGNSGPARLKSDLRALEHDRAERNVQSA